MKLHSFIYTLDFDFKNGEDLFISKSINSYILNLKHEIDNEVKLILEEEFKILKSEEISSIQCNTISRLHGLLKANISNDQNSMLRVEELKKKYLDISNSSFESIKRFKEIEIDDHHKQLLIDSMFYFIEQDSPTNSGIVIAGFGEDEYFSSYFEISVSKFLINHLYYTELSDFAIDEKNEINIKPFAQDAEVASFMKGIGNDISNYFLNDFNKLILVELPRLINELISNEVELDKESSDALRSKVDGLTKAVYEVSMRKISDISDINYMLPVVHTVKILSVTDLANMAETLINLESFRKKVTMISETVGGPIDVAVITKGDGLVWIKRKHYFKKELNHSFFENYLNF